ncbi:hypothetical protein DYB28_006488, partial [Aphanomyces astaci]
MLDLLRCTTVPSCTGSSSSCRSASCASSRVLLYPLSPSRLYNIQVDMFDGRVNLAEFFFQQILPLGMLLGSLITFKLALGRATMLELAAIVGFCTQFVPDTPSWLLLQLNGRITSFSVCLKIQSPVNHSTRAEVRVNSILHADFLS